MDEVEAQINEDRAWLVRFCARLADDRGVAEDLAQETLLVAWRNADRLYGPEVRTRWLAGIARRICLNWVRQGDREQRHRSWTTNNPYDEDWGIWPVDEFDLEQALERQELADLLDRALGHLPSDTRKVLLLRYVECSPQAEVAARLNLSLDAVEARLRRGRKALRRMLTTELREAASAYGLVPQGDDTWQETRIWCPTCGSRRLMGKFDTDIPSGKFQLKCPDCHPDPRFMHSNVYVGQGHSRDLLGGIRTFRPALNRIAAWVYDSYTSGLRDRSLTCPLCGRRSPLRLRLPDGLPGEVCGQHGIHVRCDTCGTVIWENTLSGILLSLPDVSRFWREHPRIRTLPEREVEVDGRPAVITTFESLTESVGMEVLSSAETLRALEVHEVSLG